MQGSMRNENPETTASPSHDSLACILLETTLTHKMDRRGLHGPRPRNIGHVVLLSFKNLESLRVSTVGSDDCCIPQLREFLENGCISTISGECYLSCWSTTLWATASPQSSICVAVCRSFPCIGSDNLLSNYSRFMVLDNGRAHTTDGGCTGKRTVCTKANRREHLEPDCLRVPQFPAFLCRFDSFAPKHRFCHFHPNPSSEPCIRYEIHLPRDQCVANA